MKSLLLLASVLTATGTLRGAANGQLLRPDLGPVRHDALAASPGEEPRLATPAPLARGAWRDRLCFDTEQDGSIW
ncbi:MAG: hypothetical protein ACRETX_13335, partial [Steroidobacteraceae bacterium]